MTGSGAGAAAGGGAANGRGDQRPTFRRTFAVMGTVVSFTVLGLGEADAAAGLEEACDVLREADETFSLWKTDSPVSRLRRGETELAEVPREVADVLELCRTARAWSRGWFDPWAMPGGVDPTGLVKGWAVERARDVLRQAGAAAALVSGGGDLAVLGRRPPGRSGESASSTLGGGTLWPASSRSGPPRPRRAYTSAARTSSIPGPGGRATGASRPPSPGQASRWRTPWPRR